MLKSLFRKCTWFICSSLAIVLVVLSWQYLTSNPDEYPFVQQRETYRQMRIFLLIHISFAFVALLLGPLQFIGFLRRRAPNLHRYMGLVYVLSVAVSAAASMFLAPHAFTGGWTSIGFLCLALLWCGSTWIAVIQMMNGEFRSHARWMTRSYALTFAAVTLRLELLALIFGMGLTSAEAYSIVAWSSWGLNLLIVEAFFQMPQFMRARRVNANANQLDRTV